MSPHQFGYYGLMYTQNGGAKIPDPGSGSTFHINKSFGICHLLNVDDTQTRNLPTPTSGNGIGVGTVLTVVIGTYSSGEVTITDGLSRSFVLDEAGAGVRFTVMDVAGSKKWIGEQLFAGVTSSFAELNILDGVGATAAELNMAADNSANVETVVTTNVIGATESGKTFFLNLAAGFTSTLPAAAAGLRFRFVVKTAPTGAPYVITTDSGANVLYGQMLERAGGAGVAGAARDTFNFIHNQSIIGDWVEMISDGTNWYYHGMVDVAAGNTVAAT